MRMAAIALIGILSSDRTNKIYSLRQGGAFAIRWTEGAFIVNHPEGITLRNIYYRERS